MSKLIHFINIRKLVKSFGYAVRGVRSLLIQEQNARIHLLATVVVIVAGIVVGLNRYEWISIAVAIALVWVAEAMNTAIEDMVDFISPQKDSRAGRIKDMAAGGVLICATIAVIIGLLVFIPHFIK